MKTLFFDNRRLLVLTIGIILVGGLSSYFTLPRLEDPRIIPRYATVITRYPGAMAERVEMLVTEKIETELNEISEIKLLKSFSRTGISIINIELEDRILEPEPVWSKVRNKLNDIEPLLPPGTFKPDFDDKRDAVANSLIIGLEWNLTQKVELGILNRLAIELAERLRNIEGSELIKLYGEPEEEISIQLDHEQLASLGLSSNQIAKIIQQSDAKVGAGLIRTSQSNLILEVEGELDSLYRISQIPIIQISESKLLRLKDIAEIRKSYRLPAREIAITNGKQAIVIGARIEDGIVIDHWMGKAKEVIQEFKNEIPKGVELIEIFEQTKYTNARLDSLKKNLFFGIFLVTGIIFFMMGFRSAVLVAVALPLSSACVLFGLNLLKIPIHQMSVTGLIIALGLLIDNAIVMVDETRSRLKSGLSKREALKASVSFLFGPLLGSTLTTIIAFMPIVLLEGPIGEFTAPIAISVILALVSSFFISMTIIPTVTTLFYKTSKSVSSFWENGFQSKFLTKIFSFTLRQTLRFPLLGIAFGMILPIMGFLKKAELKDQFFPASDRDQFYVQVYLERDTAIDRTKQKIKEIDTLICKTPEIKATHWFIGTSAPSVYYNMLSFEDDNTSFGEGIIQLTSAKEASKLIKKLQQKLDQHFTDVKIIFRQFGQGPPVDSPIEIRVFGPNLSQLRIYGDQIRKHLSETPNVIHSRTTLVAGKPKLLLRANEDEANLFGLSLVEMASQLEANLEGKVGGSLLEETENLPVRIRFQEEERKELGSLYSFNFVSPQNREWIPLSNIGSVDLVPELSEISRRKGERVNVIRGYIYTDALPTEVLKNFEEKLKTVGFSLPKGYRMEFGGDSEEKKEAVSKLFAYLGTLAMLMISTVVLSFNSFFLASLIGFVALFSFGLSFLSTWFSQYPFGFMSILGTAGLIGIAINDSIVVLAAIRENKKAHHGDLEEILKEVLHSSRHVISTTFTTIGGFLPLIISGGGFWPPLAIVIAGGVSGASILALYSIPSAYIFLTRCTFFGKKF